jgi:hypothetical protein
MTHFIKKLGQKRIWQRIFYERLTEPLHLNLISLEPLAKVSLELIF